MGTSPAYLPTVFRRVHIFAAALDPQSIHRLTRYEKLKTLSVNMHVLWSESPESLHLARELVPFIPSSLTSLEISCMSPDQCLPESDLLVKLASACPSLERLGLYSAASDCEACAEEITLPFPIPEWFPSAGELAVSSYLFEPEGDTDHRQELPGGVSLKAQKNQIDFAPYSSFAC